MRAPEGTAAHPDGTGSAARGKHPPTAPEQRGGPRRPSRRRAAGGRRRGGGCGGSAGRRGRGARRRDAHTGPVAAAARAWCVRELIGAGRRAARGRRPIRRPVVALLAWIDDAVAAELDTPDAEVVHVRDEKVARAVERDAS